LDGSTFECYGDKDGQTGYGDPSHRGDKANEMGNNLDVVKIAIARTAVSIQVSTHACVLPDNNNLICWGYNPHG